MEEKIVKKWQPEDKKIIVKPIWKARNPMVEDPNHENYFLYGNATISYTLPVDRNNNLHNPFDSEEEMEWLGKMLDKDLNIYKQHDNIFMTHKVKLGKDDKPLNLRNPKDYLDYIILKANKRQIAPDGDSMFKKGTYRYALVSEEFETNKTVSEADQKIAAYKHLGKLEDNKRSMLNFLKVYGKRVSENSKIEFLKSELSKIVTDDIEGFLSIAKDKDNYEIKLLIADAIDCGAVIKQGRTYHLPGGDSLCAEGDTAVIDIAIAYLKAPRQQDLLNQIKLRVDTAQD